LGTKITLSFLLLFFTAIGVAQSRKQIQGKIIVADAKPSNVLILNLNTQQEVVSDINGSFTILAQDQDVLIFSSKDLDYMRKIVEISDVKTPHLSVTMTSKRVVLEEVEIKSYTAVSLGILQKPAVSYTVAERRLKTAGDFKPIHLLAILGGGMPLDPVFNAISGRTKRLKKEVKLERSQKRLQQFQAFFSKEEMIDQVKVDSSEVMRFTYFILDKEEFINILEGYDKNKMLFYLIQMHRQYKHQSQSDEKE
jgi:hypothetical protein